MQIAGAIPALGSPLDANDKIDTGGLRRLIRYVLAGGVHGLLANGSMGGFAFLPDEEQLRAIDTTVEEVGGKVPVMGGLGETGTIRAVRHARAIARLGVDAISILPPYYFLATQEHLIAWFSEIAAAVDIPIYLYDNPVLTKQHLQPQTVAILRERIPHLAGIKVSNPDCLNLQTLLELVGDGGSFSVLTGCEHLALVHLQMGCHGMIGGLYNLCPHIPVALYKAFQAGDINRARKLQSEMSSAWQLFTKGAIWGAFDEALRYLGICERATGAPYVTLLNETDRQYVRSILDQYVKPWLDADVPQAVGR